MCRVTASGTGSNECLEDLDTALMRLREAEGVAESRRALMECLNTIYTLHSWCERYGGDAYRQDVYHGSGQIVAALVFVRGQKVHDLTRSVGPTARELVIPFTIPGRLGHILRWSALADVQTGFVSFGKPSRHEENVLSLDRSRVVT